MRKILRSDAEAALDAVTEMCKAAADYYRTAARIAHDPEFVKLFRRLEQERQRWAQELEIEVRELGNLPSAPDADREALEHLLTRLRAVFAKDESSSLLHESHEVEKKLGELLQAALREDIPVTAQALLKTISDSSSTARHRLIPSER